MLPLTVWMPTVLMRPKGTPGRRLTPALIAALSCLVLITADHGSTSAPPAPRRETGAERLARLRARVRSKLVRKAGAMRLEAAGASIGPVAAGDRVLSSEVQANSGVPGTESETSIAVSGIRVVVGYNQINGNKGSGVAYSTDGGLTYTDSGGLPVGGNLPKELVGDPSVTVCGDGTFYYGSIYFPNASDSALAVNAGTFSGTTLSWTNPKVAAVSGSDFLDKPWLTCDRATNTLYIAYTRFVNANIGLSGPLQVEIIKSIDGGNTWTVPLVLENSPTESVQIG